MSALDALLHLLNFMLPALLLGGIAAGFAKLAWPRMLAGVRWWRLAAAAGGAALLVSIGGVVLTGRDGAMATYAAMVAACALGLGWAGWRRR